jgi:hypothetical protein
MAPMQSPDHHQLLGDFEIVRELGRGSMGIVYEARQRCLSPVRTGDQMVHPARKGGRM